MVYGYQCYNRSQKISALNNVLLPNYMYKGIKCVTQFITLFSKSRENKQN